jgi:hypothetical protein
MKIYNRSLNQHEVALLADTDNLNAQVLHCDSCFIDSSIPYH